MKANHCMLLSGQTNEDISLLSTIIKKDTSP